MLPPSRVNRYWLVSLKQINETWTNSDSCLHHLLKHLKFVKTFKKSFKAEVLTLNSINEGQFSLFYE